MKSNDLHFGITHEIIRAFYTVYNTLGFGFLEKVSENAMLLELTRLGMRCKQQQQLSVF